MLHVRALDVVALQILVQHGKDLGVEHLEAADAIDHALQILVWRTGSENKIR